VPLGLIPQAHLTGGPPGPFVSPELSAGYYQRDISPGWNRLPSHQALGHRAGVEPALVGSRGFEPLSPSVSAWPTRMCAPLRVARDTHTAKLGRLGECRYCLSSVVRLLIAFRCGPARSLNGLGALPARPERVKLSKNRTTRRRATEPMYICLCIGCATWTAPMERQKRTRFVGMRNQTDKEWHLQTSS
jgi:hypothetical protein